LTERHSITIGHKKLAAHIHSVFVMRWSAAETACRNGANLQGQN